MPLLRSVVLADRTSRQTNRSHPATLGPASAAVVLRSGDANVGGDCERLSIYALLASSNPLY
jgi:hypothetical protein